MRRFVVFMMLGAATMACGKKEESKPAPNVQQAIREIPKPVEDTPEQKAQRDADYKAEQVRRRDADLLSVRQNFLPNKYPVADDVLAPGWRSELYAEYKPPFGTACRDHLVFESRRNAFLLVGDPNDYSGVGKLTWEEVGLTEKEALAQLTTEGLKVAREFMAIYKVPLEERVRAEKCSTGGEGAGFRFTDTNALTSVIDNTLLQIIGEPKDLGPGITAESWRTTALEDFRKRIERLKGGKEANYRLVIAHEASQQWHFKPEEVGLTAAEIAEYLEQYVQAAR